jgi:carbonic anhydrase
MALGDITPSVTEQNLSPAQAWARLEEGNRHWAEGHLAHPDQDITRRQQVALHQDPFATIVSCIDSRVPPETVFDQGIGDLFAVRTGAQTIDGLVTASIEYGPLENGTPLIVVLGHERCGAITAAAHAIKAHRHLPGHLDAIVHRLRPVYDHVTAVSAAKGNPDLPEQTLIAEMVHAQVARTLHALALDGPLKPLVANGTLGIVGATYDLDTGMVTRLQTLGF